MKDDQDALHNLCVAFGGIAAFIAIVAVEIIWGGYVLTVLWRWFVVPVFDAPALTVAQAAGLSLTVGYATQRIGRKEDRKLNEVLRRAAYTVTALPLITLLFGWVIQHWT